MSLRGNGLKVLTANNFIPSQTPIIECRGKYMLGSGNHRYISIPSPLDQVFYSLPLRSRNAPYVLSHSLCPDLEVVVDGKTYGNDSRYCRRADSKSGEANAVVRHHLDKGSLHLYIVASRNIDRNQEILLPAVEVSFLRESLAFSIISFPFPDCQEWLAEHGGGTTTDAKG